MSAELPPDPFHGTADSAVQLHEIMRSFMAGGFTEAQAFELVKAMIIHGLERQI